MRAGEPTARRRHGPIRSYYESRYGRRRGTERLDARRRSDPSRAQNQRLGRRTEIRLERGLGHKGSKSRRRQVERAKATRRPVAISGNGVVSVRRDGRRNGKPAEKAKPNKPLKAAARGPPQRWLHGTDGQSRWHAERSMPEGYRWRRLIGNVRQQGHEASPFDGSADCVLTGGSAAALTPAD